MDYLNSLVDGLPDTPYMRPALILVAAVVAALFLRFFFFRLVLALTGRTRTGLDDEIIHSVRNPAVYSALLAGAMLALAGLPLSDLAHDICRRAIKTLVLLIWAAASIRVGLVLLRGTSRRSDRRLWIQPTTLPLFEIVLKTVVAGGALYFVLITWQINVSSWVASAGIVGLAVGLAAKDSLANLFAGVFILTDSPYKIGDFVVLDNNVRGLVTDIGVRSTRVLTRDDVEVTVPNAVIGNAQIINETGGPHQKMRVRVKVGVAYGSDIDRVIEVLLSCTDGMTHVAGNPEPRVRFREFGDSGLLFELLAWIDEPVYRGKVLHELNSRVYKALGAAGIEIPYPKRDVYIKEMPGAEAGRVAAG